MVGDHQRGGAALHSAARVLHVEHAFEDQLAGPEAPDPVHVPPIQRRIELTGDPLRQFVDIFHPGDVAGEVAEILSLAAQHADRP